MQVNKLLKQIGFNDKEIKIYEAMLELGAAPASIIAKQSDLPRQTVYSILKEMAERGYIEISEKFGVTQFIGDPQSLLLFLDKQQAELTKLGNQLKENIPKMIALRRQKALPAIQLFEGEEGMKKLLEHILEYYRKGGEKEFRGFGINKIDDVSINHYLRDFLERRHNYGVKTKLLASTDDDDFIIKPNQLLGRQIKKVNLPAQKAAMYLVGNRVYVFSYWDKVGLMVQNDSISKLLRDYFDLVWKNK